MAPSEKRCHYEVLGLNRDCSTEEIRSAYKKLALQRHPDKLIQIGVPKEEATAAFQELFCAYELLSDPDERAWYDSHPSELHCPSSKSYRSPVSVPDLFPFFSTGVYSGFGDKGKGFYKVYSDIFDRIYEQEVNYVTKLGLAEVSVRVSPLMGNLETPFTQVKMFYKYWLDFVTVLDFSWVKKSNVMAGMERRTKRVYKNDNKKARKKARREYIKMDRELAEFVMKWDKRVIDMRAKRVAEQEKKKAERVECERAKMHEEPDSVKIHDEEGESVLYEEEVENKMKHELYCVVCSKIFKSDNQWKNHERSKKHCQKVTELWKTYGSEEKEDCDADFGPSPYVDELRVKFENDIGFLEENEVL